MFHCDGYKCIPEHMTCDGYSHCEDKMDEDIHHCGKTYTNRENKSTESHAKPHVLIHIQNAGDSGSPKHVS